MLGPCFISPMIVVTTYCKVQAISMLIFFSNLASQGVGRLLKSLLQYTSSTFIILFRLFHHKHDDSVDRPAASGGLTLV